VLREMVEVGEWEVDLVEECKTSFSNISLRDNAQHTWIWDLNFDDRYSVKEVMSWYITLNMKQTPIYLRSFRTDSICVP